MKRPFCVRIDLSMFASIHNDFVLRSIVYIGIQGKPACGFDHSGCRILYHSDHLPFPGIESFRDPNLYHPFVIRKRELVQVVNDLDVGQGQSGIFAPHDLAHSVFCTTALTSWPPSGPALEIYFSSRDGETLYFSLKEREK